VTAGIQLPDRRRATSTQGRRVLLHTGRLVAFVGADGSGKSTVTTEITRWLSADIAAVRMYFGSGKGTISLPRRLLELAAAVTRLPARTRRRVSHASIPAAPAPFHRGAGRSRIRDWGDLLWVLALSRERHARFRQARRARDKGMVVICDRFPQSQFPGLNDGPWLSHWLDHPSWIRRAVARKERAAFWLAERCAPDLVVKLHVPLETALTRRPDVPRAQLTAKLHQLKQLAYPWARRVVDIDAGQSLERVLFDVKRVVRACL